MSRKTKRVSRRSKTHKKHKIHKKHKTRTKRHLNRKRRKILIQGLPLFSKPINDKSNQIIISYDTKASGNMIPGLRNM
jgi:hypothetical protein